MPRYIDIDKMNRWTEVDQECCSRDSCDSCDYDCNECFYNNGGAEDVAPVVHAKWVPWEELYECSNCGFALKDNRAKYCQHCGAKMDEVIKMTNFDEITKDTETLADFMVLVNGGECSGCVAGKECEKLQQAGETYNICFRSWCNWLNKED